MTDELLQRYQRSLLGVFGEPQLVLERGEGSYVVDADNRRYLDLLGGIAVNSLGHQHPVLVRAISEQAVKLIHTSNFFTTKQQITLAERLLDLASAPSGSKVFFCNSGTEANEAAFKLARATGRERVIVADGGFHGRTMGALSLTSKQAYRDPFEPLIPGVLRVPFGDTDALASVLDETVGAVILEPIQGEAGVVEPPRGYLTRVRELTQASGALMVMDEVQTGVGRTGQWFAHQSEAVIPDAMTLAKGLGGGVPIGALVTFGQGTSELLTPGQHGTTFGGNPLACAAANAVLDVVGEPGFLQQVSSLGEHVKQRINSLADERVCAVRGRGLLLGIGLRDAVAPAFVSAARGAGFIVNAPNPNTIRLAPPLTITADELDTFLDAVISILDSIGEA